MHGWPFLPSVTQEPIGLVPEALPRLRLEPPLFDGENAADWIHKIQKYYNYHCTPLDDRPYLAKYLFDHQASHWMTFWEENNKGKSWDDFLLAVKQRFDLDLYDYVGRLATLRKNSSVEAYQTLFKALLPKASHIGDSMLSYLFIAGLKPPLKQRVLWRRPSTLQETFSIAQQLQACCAATTSPGPFTRTGGTSRDQWQPNRTTPHPDVNQEPDRQPLQRIKEITHVSDVNQFGVQPLNAVSSQSFAKGSGPKIFVCNESMNKNTESIIDIVSKADGSDTMSCFENLETISKEVTNDGDVSSKSEQPEVAFAMDEVNVVDPFLCIDNSNSYLQLGCLSVDVESRFQNCKVAYGNSQVEARHNPGVFNDASSDARTIPPTDTFPSRVVPSSLQIFATSSTNEMLHYGHPEVEVNAAIQIPFGLKTYEERVLGSSRIPNFSKTMSFY